MTFKIEVIVNYYPKNLFPGEIFNEGIFKNSEKGSLKPRVKK